MSSLNKKLAVVRVTTLAAALMGVYGAAGATPNPPVKCVGPAECTTPNVPVDGETYGYTSSTGGQTWILKGEQEAKFGFKDGFVNASGNNVRGIGSTAGSDLTIQNVTITTNGNSGHGVQANDDRVDGTGSHIKIDGSRIELNGTGYAVGISSQTLGSMVEGTGNTIITKGAGASGVETDRGGSISLTGGSITTMGVGAAGARAISGASGLITLDGTTVLTKGVKSIGLMAGDKDGASGPETAGDITFKNGSVQSEQSDAAKVQFGSQLVVDNSTVISDNAKGLVVDGSGSTATLVDTNVTGKTRGIHVLNNGSVFVTNGIVKTGVNSSNNSSTVHVDTGSSVVANGVQFIAETDGLGTGDLTNVVWANGPGTTIELHGGRVDNNNSKFGRGLLASTNAFISTDGTAITTSGELSNAVHAYSAKKGLVGVDDKPTIILSGGAVDTVGADSYGLLAQNNGSSISATGLSVTTQGANSYGAVAYNGSAITLSNVGVKTSGTNAHGISMGATSVNQIPKNEPVSNVASSITVTGGSISATGAGSSAVNLQDSGTVSLTGTTLISAGSTFVSAFMQAGQAQGITLGSGTTVAANNGELLRVTRGSAGLDGTVALNLGAGSFAQGNVYDMDGSKLVSVTKTGDAQWAGMVVDQSTQQIDPSTPPAPNYTTTENVIITSPAPVTFTGTTSMGAFSGATGGTSTFAGPTSITGNLIGAQGSSTNFSGNANIGGSITSGSGSTTTFSGPSTTIGGSVGGNGGTFAFSRTGSTSIGGSLSLSGPSQVTGGTINNPITVGGDATVGAGAVLGGNLVVTGALGGSGGTLSPGNSVGTQVYGTSAEFSGAYKAEVNAAGKSDLIVISNGNFDLSNIALTVAQENGNGGYVLNHDYTIVQTPGGEVVNTFKPTPALDSSFAGTLVKLDPVKYGAKDVKVSLSVDNSAAQAKRAGLSGNQNATLDGVLSVAGKNTAADAALQSTDTAGAMNQLSGEVHASTSSALLAAGGLVQRTVAQRMRGNLGVGMTAGAPTAQAGGAPVAGSMPQSAALPLWAQVVGNWNTLSDDGNAAKVKSNMGGVFIGGDTAVGSGWRVGGALGFTDGQIDVDDRSSRTKARSYTASLYGGNSWATGKGSVNFLAGAAYTRHNLDSRRSITLAGGQKLTADYHANSAQLFTELGYALPVGANSVVEPYAGLAWLSQRMQGFSESGGSAALRSDSQTDTVTTFTLGLRGKTTMELSAGKRVTLFAGLGWRHASGDVTSTRNLAFIQGNGASFQVSGAPIAKNAALVDAGVEASIGRNAALGLSYNGQYGSGNTNHVGSLYVKMRF